MLDKLSNALHFQQQALGLLNQRQQILAGNIANADTPGYQARDIDFTQQLKARGQADSVNNSSLTLAITAKGHISAQTSVLPDARLLYRVPDQPSADGNTVDMDRERVQFADNNVKYQSSLTFLNGEIKKMMSVLQG